MHLRILTRLALYVGNVIARNNVYLLVKKNLASLGALFQKPIFPGGIKDDFGAWSFFFTGSFIAIKVMIAAISKAPAIKIYARSNRLIPFRYPTTFTPANDPKAPKLLIKAIAPPVTFAGI